MSANNGWIGVDLDGTLAHYDGWKGVDHIGEPVELMVNRVKEWLSRGIEVRIFTARVWHPLLGESPRVPIANTTEDPAHLAMVERYNQAQAARRHIQEWCLKHIGLALEVTCMKDFLMIELWDDRAVRIQLNTGMIT